MTWETYTQLFEEILNGSHNDAPYDKESYLTYTKLNFSRQKRWLKQAQLNPELVEHLKNLPSKQSWVLITEPWCGDASHSNPFIYLLSQLSENIEFSINLRDGESGMIHDYLTNGGMSIPILVVRDANGTDLFHWGPRPAACQALFLANKNDASKTEEDKKIELQAWYNENKGKDLQAELLVLLQNSVEG